MLNYINSSWEYLTEDNIIVFRSVETEAMHHVSTVTEECLILKLDNDKVRKYLLPSY